RSSVILLTDRPRYSVTTVAVDALNCSVISATAVIFSAFAILRLLSGCRFSCELPSSITGASEKANAPVAERSRGAQETRFHASFPTPALPAWVASNIAGPSTARGQQPTVFGRTIGVDHRTDR